MINFKKPLLIALSSTLLLTACTEPGETTAIGAATGGVIGAGLGAIVGNQTGNAGSGLVIGAVAGAGAGAAIGNGLDAQQKSVRTQDEALERQQKMLAAQNAEIKELRNMPRDANTAIGSAFEKEAAMPRNKPRIVSLNDDSSTSLTDQLNTGADQAPSGFQASNNSRARSQVTSLSPGFSSTESRAAMKQAVIEPQAQAAPSKEKISASLNERSLDISPSPDAHASLEDAGAVKEPEAKKVVDSSINKNGECGKADSEAEKANSSKEPADKLFYLRRAIRLCPSNASYHTHLADEYAQLGRNEDAKASYEDALKLDPSLSDAKKGIASLSSNKY